MDPVASKNSKITGEVRTQLKADLRAAYEGGASVRQIAAGIGRSYGSAHLLLAEAGVTFRRRGGQAGRARRRS
jgi:hypothetical protein